ncbi:hypothetical protein M878_08530 [Streptomyces roseochromogenus subsp. oscitans DS 12.976]|uniref:Uncharacterized protein n=1 Tax=Streptomyces roseochromogenus subsp. oscitans DS 12.976 TaxID=1352936 RepID=V6KRS9_STRRC|nr:hypothetical protein M878_08530 [Streptomyces roseochromogenus subsp. oscitans DS 12.976]
MMPGEIRAARPLLEQLAIQEHTPDAIAAAIAKRFP